MRVLLPKKVCFVKGVGEHKDALMSFELALRDAGINGFNLVRVSSILPAGCKIVEPKTLLERLKCGEVVFCVMAKITTKEKGEAYASIGYASHDRVHGYLTEYAGVSREGMRFSPVEHAKDMARKMFVSLHGFPPKSAGGIEIREKSSGRGFLTLVAAAVFSLR